MITLDTNYIVRFFTRDVESQFLEAKKVIVDKNSEKYISPIILAETIYILENHYMLGKNEVISAISDLLAIKSIKTAGFLRKALMIYKDESVSFYDSMIVAETLESKYELRTFDSKLNKVYKKYLV